MTPENPAAAGLKLNRPLRLNCGSGQRPFGGPEAPWVNIDSQDRWSPDLLCDITQLPYEKGTVDMVVAHHVLEHLELSKGGAALVEWRRVLKPDGSLIVCVPNAPEIAKRWLAGQFSDYIFGSSMYGAFMGAEADFHRWCYSYRSLREALMEAGFARVRLFDFRSIPGADIANDPTWILAVEAWPS